MLQFIFMSLIDLFQIEKLHVLQTHQTRLNTNDDQACQYTPSLFNDGNIMI